MQNWRDGVAVAETRVSDLQAALAVATQKDAAADQARRVAGHQAMVRALQQHIAARTKEALKISAAISNLSDAFMAIQQANQKVAALMATEGIRNSQAIVTFGSLYGYRSHPLPQGGGS
jgi:hypothetical protein